ncbi:MAG: adenylate/guanylate cyclase domain-containing protein [Acidimicrobiia bacterium]
MVTLPRGTVTFLFTDIEDSTDLNASVGDERFRGLLERHNALIRAVLDEHGGVEVATEGDSFFAVFTSARSALEAAVDIDLSLAGADWGESKAPRVRIGAHTGTGVVGADNYVGVDVNKAHRVASSAHGGQIVLSRWTVEALGPEVPRQGTITDLGKYKLRGFKEPESIYQLSVPGVSLSFPPLRAPRAESRLPTQFSEFVGRDAEIALGIEALGKYRLLTLTGPGGTGKTRLALELARSVEEQFEFGAWFVPLSSIREPHHIAGAILDAFQLQSAVNADSEEHVANYLAGKSMLLVLDNFEQLVEGSSIVSNLLDRAGQLKVIVTSRVPLHLAGERELPIPPLDVPEPGAAADVVSASEGVQLFVRRASAVRPDFRLDEGNFGTIATITRSLDGLPLAIELAASRMRSLTPDLILERLGNQLLTSQSREIPARQQTIVNAIGWSYDLLDESSRKLFEELSVFSGGFRLAEAEKVCADGLDVLDGLTRLVDQSLLLQTEIAGEPRFRMLTVIREFAYAALVARRGDRSVLDQHAAVYLPIAEEASREILTSKQGYWLGRLTADQDNMRAALGHVISVGDGSTACRYVSSLWRYWQIKGQLTEARELTESALSLVEGVDPIARAHALTALAGILYWQGDWPATSRPYREALEIFESHDLESEVAGALYNLSFPLGYMGDFDGAMAVLRRSLEISEKTHDMNGVGLAYWGLGNLYAYQERWEEVVEFCGRSADIFSDIDAPFDLGWARFMLAFAFAKQGKIDPARASLRLAADLFSGVGDLSAMALILDSMSAISLKVGDRRRSAYFAGAARRIKLDTGVTIGEVDINEWPESVEFLSNLDVEEAAALDEGFVADLSDVIAALRQTLD